MQPDGTRKALPLWCSSCNAALTLQHLSTCAANTVFRDSQRDAIVATLAACASGWLAACTHLPLEELLFRLFPPPPAMPLHLHITHTMCGVFSTRQANAACKLLGVSNAKDAQRHMQQLRLCCVDGVHSLFSALKLAHS